MSTPRVGSPRGGYARSANGLVGALIAVLGLIAVVGGLSWLQHGKVADPARTVDYAASLARARDEAPFPVVAPSPVPSGLRATSVSWDGAGVLVAWHLGFVTSGDDYLGLYEGNGPAAAFISASTPATDPGPPVTIAGVMWQTLHSPDQAETALLRRANGVTTVVTGTAGETQLEMFAGRLR